jgi:hypothetical protein
MGLRGLRSRGHRWCRFIRVVGSEGARVTDGGHRGRWRSLVEDELEHRGWREPRSGTMMGTPAASRLKAGSGTVMMTWSGLGIVKVAVSRPRPIVASREAAV